MIALLVSDLHLSHQKPSIRAEVGWYGVMAGYLKQLNDMIPAWDVPVICGGDLVDRWNQPPEFISFCIDHLPEMYAVPGQHDLPNHSWDELYRSAFGLLARIGKVKRLDEHSTAFRFYLDDEQDSVVLRAYGFGWEKQVRPPLAKEKNDRIIDLAVVHRYVWSNPGNSYPDASEEGLVTKINKEFRPYDVVLFGDNHHTVSWIDNQHQHRLNPGTFIRRKSDEINHRPCVGLLKADGSIERKYLDVSGDKFVDRPEAADSAAEGLEEFVEGLKSLDHSSLDFRDAVRKAVENEKLSKRAGKLVLQAMEE